MSHFYRRTFIKTLGIGLASFLSVPVKATSQANNRLIQKPIPSTRELLTVIGMGTWQTFNVGSDPQLRKQRTEVMRTFFQLGGQMIDSSPMYGSSQDMIGYGLQQLNYPKELFSAEKVWTRRGNKTREHINSIANKWGVERFDLMQVHNLLSWQAHLEKLLEMKRKGELGYVGITTSHGRRHSELEQIMATQPIDFVQLTYNLEDREAEQRLLPLAKEKGIAVIANRPFQGGYLLDRLQGQNAPLPSWAQAMDCDNWPQFLLKFIVSHPAVTCAIPATTQILHMQENMGGAMGLLPDAEIRKKMIAHFKSI